MQPTDSLRVGTLLGVALVLLWLVLAGVSLRANKLVGAPRTWIPAQETLGVDLLGPYQAAKHSFTGGNPYREPFGDPFDRPHIYPPLATWLFGWAAFVPEDFAVLVWSLALMGLLVPITLVALRWRRTLGLSEIPWPMGLAMVAWSMPVIFSLERGNCDLVALALILAGALALERQTLWGDALAGGTLAMAAWLKIYPGFLVIPLVMLKRTRALGAFVAAGFFIALLDVPGVLDWLISVRTYASDYDIDFEPSAHSLSTYWHRLCPRELGPLRQLPGGVVAAAMLLPPAAFVCWLLGRTGDVRRSGPLLLWMTALASFLPPVANDYNLVALPVLLLTIVDRRHPWWVVVMGLTLLPGIQPFRIPFIGFKLLFLLKLVGLWGLALVLVRGRRSLENCQGLLARTVPFPRVA